MTASRLQISQSFSRCTENQPKLAKGKNKHTNKSMVHLFCCVKSTVKCTRSAIPRVVYWQKSGNICIAVRGLQFNILQYSTGKVRNHLIGCCREYRVLGHIESEQRTEMEHKMNHSRKSLHVINKFKIP